MEGRQILDVVLITNGAINSRIKSSNNKIIYKLDIEKVYNLHQRRIAFAYVHFNPRREIEKKGCILVFDLKTPHFQNIFNFFPCK